MLHPTELNLLTTAITNHLYCNLSEKEFFRLGVFLSLLGKEILGMEVIRDLCKVDKKDDEKKQDNDKKQDDKKHDSR